MRDYQYLGRMKIPVGTLGYRGVGHTLSLYEYIVEFTRMAWEGMQNI